MTRSPTGKRDPKSLRQATRLVHGGTLRSQFGEMSEAIFLTQGFAYDSMETAEKRFTGEEPGYQYARFSNPTVTMFEQRMALLEGAEAARATASGMAAVTAAIMGQVKAGDHIVAAKALFGSCRFIVEDLAPRFGVECTLVDGNDIAQWKAAMRPNTKTTFIETPTNPQLDVLDIRAIADVAHAHGATLVVDNVFATALLQSPLDYGADCVVYSATKHVDGQGRCLAGCILGSEKFINDNVHNYLRQTGPALSPFNAWVMVKSLETMPLRVHQQVANAVQVADFLAEQKAVKRVLYPFRKDHPNYELAKRQMKGGGQVVVFDLEDKAAAFKFGNALEIIKISNNLGDAKSILTHPATTTHQRIPMAGRLEMGIGEGMLRLSVGLEDVEDIKEDLAQALKLLG
jgi:O-succinylhomoserine sulfhydrylase